jgi:hypothetical protein
MRSLPELYAAVVYLLQPTLEHTHVFFAWHPECCESLTLARRGRAVPGAGSSPCVDIHSLIPS